jgi:hypothetical protein
MNDYLLTYRIWVKGGVDHIKTFKWFENEEDLREFLNKNKDIIEPIEAICILDSRKVNM